MSKALGVRLAVPFVWLTMCGAVAPAQDLPSFRQEARPSTTQPPLDFGPVNTETTVSALAFYPAFSGQPYSTSGSLGRFGQANVDEHFYATVDLPLGAVIDYIALNNLNDNTPNVIFLTLLFRNENAAIGTIATIGNTAHSNWETDFSAGTLGYLYYLHLPLILDVEITADPNLLFFGNARIGWHRSVSAAPLAAYFDDVPMSHPFFQFISALYGSGITAGCQTAPPLYCPDNPVTRGQMAVFLAKALGLNWPN